MKIQEDKEKSDRQIKEVNEIIADYVFEDPKYNRVDDEPIKP